MPEFLNNPWVVSIVCGLIATAIGFGASRLLDNLYNKRLASRIKSANDFTISQYEVYLVNNSKPLYEILVALRCNAARKFNVSADELLSVGACIEAVVSGIISNVYLNADQQKTHLANVSTILSVCKKSYVDDHPRRIPRTALPVSIGVFVTTLCAMSLESSFIAISHKPRSWMFLVFGALFYSAFTFFMIYYSSVKSFRRKERLYNDTLKSKESQILSAREPDVGKDNHTQQTSMPAPFASNVEDTHIIACSALPTGKEDCQATPPEGEQREPQI